MDNREKPSLGIVGLGLIGGALASRLLDAGYVVHGYDADPRKAQALAPLGVEPANSVSALAARCDIAIIAVYDTGQASEVLDAVLDAAGRCRTAICVSTCDPEGAVAMGARAEANGFAFIEFPLSGNSAQVRAGEALGLVAGNATAVAAADVVLQVLSPKRFTVGSAGDAARAKLAVNLVLQLNRAALAEGLVFAEAMGLDPTAFLRLLGASPAASEVMRAKGGKMLERNYSPESRIAQTLKDAQLMLDEAYRLHLGLPLMQENARLLARSIELGGPDQDSAAVIEALRRRT